LQRLFGALLCIVLDLLYENNGNPAGEIEGFYTFILLKWWRRFLLWYTNSIEYIICTVL